MAPRTILAFISILLVSCSAIPGVGKIDSCVAIRPPNAATPGGAQRAWAQPSNFWPQGARLRVQFLGGTTKQRHEAWSRIQQIDALVNLSLVQVAGPPSDIRIAFRPGGGHWSYLGRSARSIPASQQTMNLDLRAGFFGDMKAEWDRVVLHEALHAIGLEHEHQHPEAGIKWNKPVVYDYYARTQGWSRGQVDFQVLNRYAGTSWRGTPYDSTSIMQYPVPRGHADIEVGWNDRLSAGDVIFIKQSYP